LILFFGNFGYLPYKHHWGIYREHKSEYLACCLIRKCVRVRAVRVEKQLIEVGLLAEYLVAQISQNMICTKY
jgi:hypothetical protein